MKLFISIIAFCLTSAFAFTAMPYNRNSPALLSKQSTRSKVELNAIFDAIANLDLFAPKKGQNDYGARKNKVLKVGNINEKKSYVPSGLTAGQYNSMRTQAQKKKDANYARNVSKAGIFENFTEFYKKRGTDTTGSWYGVTNGHKMVKTKFDWSGKVDNSPKQVGLTSGANKNTKGKFGKK